MSYLTRFRRHHPAANNWTGGSWSGHNPEHLLTEVDASLNSWKEAHEVFDQHQLGKDKVDRQAFMMMRGLVHKAIRYKIQNTQYSYPIEALTYVLLERWIKVCQLPVQAS